MAIKTQGTQLYFVRPGTLDVVNLGCITAIENVGAPIQPRDVTPVESDWEISEPGIFSLGQIDLEIRFDPSTSGHIDVLDMYEGRQTANFAIGLGDGASPPQIDDDGEFVGVGGRSFLAFRGWIMDVPFSFPLNENLPAAVSIMQVPSLVPGVLGVGLLPAEAGIPCASDSQYGGGADFPSVVPVVLGDAHGWVMLEFMTGAVPDKLEVWIDGQLVLDTGYVGDVGQQAALDAALAARGLPSEPITQRTGTGSTEDDWPDPFLMDRAYFYKDSPSSLALVRVYAPIGGTRWVFRLGCPDPYTYQVISESGNWIPPDGVDACDALIVGGGGGGGSRQGGGGGAGGVRVEYGIGVSPGVPVPIVVGAGGAGGAAGDGDDGGSSFFGPFEAVGGGAGGGRNGGSLGQPGGSGGGGANGLIGGFGLEGQGMDGGRSIAFGSNSGAGGGGYSQVGDDGVGLDQTAIGGDGGDGVSLGLLGFYPAVHEGAPGAVAGGGGGGVAPEGVRAGRGGYGGGGHGQLGSDDFPRDGEPGTGGGGGGAGGSSAAPGVGASGGSGIVVVRYVLPDSGEGDAVDEG